MPSNTRSVAQSMQWATYFVGNRALAFSGTGNEPAVTSANLVCQVMMQPPFKWRWNRASVSFLTVDPAATWILNNAYALGFRFKDTNGNMQTVTTAGLSGAVQPSWNTTVGGTTNDGAVIWTMSLLTDYVQNVPNFGFFEKAQVQSLTGTQKITEIPESETESAQDLGSGRANSVSPYLDDNNGNITFRFMPGVPDVAYRVTVYFQQKPALLTALTGAGSVWPIPDEYMFVYDWGFLAFCYMFADSQKFSAANAKFISGLLGLSEGLSEQQIAVFLGQYDFILQNAMRNQARTAQGFQGRGT